MPALRTLLAAASILLPACAAAPGGPSPIAATTKPASPASPQVAPAPAAPAPTLDSQAALAAKIDPIFADFARDGAHTPGCSVGVYRAGEVLFSKGYGYADLEHDAPITDTTPFYTASVSKQFTAAAVLLLAADGKLSLHDDVRKYVPELPDFGATITLEQLLHHTSGLRDYHLLLLLDGTDEEGVVTRQEILWLLAHQRALNFRPGEHFSYSSSGYVLLAEIVARVSGESFHAFLTRRVLAPLGMTSSLVREHHARVIPHRAIGYERDPAGEVRSRMGNLEYDGSSNFVTTTRDLARWDANFYDPKVGGSAWLAAMRAPGKLNDGTPLDYASGLAIDEAHGRPSEWHDGGFAGYRATLVRYPTERLTVSVLCNTAEADPDALGEKLSVALLPPLATPEPVAPAPAPAPAASFGPDLAALAGRYVEQSTADTRVVEVSDGVVRMRYEHPALRTRELVPAGPDALVVKGGHTRYVYEAAKGTQPARLVRQSKTDLSSPFVRADAAAGGKAAPLADYAGRYGSGELPRDLEIRVEEGHLVAGPVGGAARTPAFAPVDRDLFVTEGAGETDGVGWRFERDARGKVVRLVASTDRARGVSLVRR